MSEMDLVHGKLAAAAGVGAGVCIMGGRARGSEGGSVCLCVCWGLAD